MKIFKFLPLFFVTFFCRSRSRKKLVSVLISKKFCGLGLGLERFDLDYSPGNHFVFAMTAIKKSDS